MDDDRELEKLVTSVEGIEEKLEDLGVAVVRNVLSEGQCEAALTAVLQHHSNADAEVHETGVAEQWFSQRYPNRDDLLLPYTLPAVCDSLSAMLRVLSSPLVQLLGEEAMCAELAAHISQPGAAENSWHRDHRWTQSRQIVCCFAALQDIPHDLGPTEVYPGTHKIPGTVEEIQEAGMQYVQLRLRRGDVALMDVRLMHRGGARQQVNRANQPRHRVLLYHTWREWCCSFGDDFIPSILPEYAGRLPLSDWKTWTVNGPMELKQPHRVQLWESSLAKGQPDGGYVAAATYQNFGSCYQDDCNSEVDFDDLPDDAEAMAELMRESVKAI